MLKHIFPKLRCPVCAAGGRMFNVHSFEETPSRVICGALVCQSCKSFYPIEDNLLELVPPELLYPDDLRKFIDRFRVQLENAGVLVRETIPEPIKNASAQIEQRKHFDWFSENQDQDYSAYQNTPFWRAVDAATFRNWRDHLQPGSWLLDIGCADGRSTFQLSTGENFLVGLDISKKMLRQAVQRAKQLGISEQCSFLVGDGSVLPFEDGAFDFASTYGVLHHLPNPGKTCGDIVRILRAGGIFFASENNLSFFRPIFDWLMRRLPLWLELAGEEPLISRGMIKGWFASHPVSLCFHTMVFLPPYLYNWAGPRLAKPLLYVSDALARFIPGLRENGGLIVGTVTKI